MSKIRNWEVILYEFLEAARNNDAKFKLGTHDCYQFGCDWIEAATGESPCGARKAAGKYKTASDVKDVIKNRLKASGLDSVYNEHLTPVRVESRARGDILCVMNGGRKAIAVFDGKGAVGLAEDGGLVDVRITPDEILNVWRI